MKGYRFPAISAPFFKILEALFELMIPLVVKSIIDVGIANSDKPYIVKMVGLMVLLGLIGFSCTLCAQYFAARAAVGFSANIRSALFGHAQTLSFTEIDRLGTSTMITRMTNDVTQVQSGVNLTLRLFSRSPVIVFGSMIMAFTIDVKAALVFAVAIPLLCIVVFGIMLITMPLYKRVQAGLDRVLKMTRETISGVRVIRAFGKQEDEITDFRAENERLTATSKRVGHISSLMNPLTYVIINVGIIALINIGAIRVYEDPSLTQGEVVALYNYMSQILVELIKLANLIISITKALASASRIEAVLEKEPSQTFGTVDSPEEKGEYALEFLGAALRYHGVGEDAISGIDLKVRHGETLGVIGGTGSGKTSLVNLIPRFYDATSGEVRVNGVNVKDYTEEGLRKRIACVPQKAVLFRGTLRDNLKWGNASATDEELLYAADTAEAAKVVEEKGGLDAVIEQGGKNLSGGQRQRLTVARALARKPEILILDDSSSALDYATDAALRAKIRERVKDTTVVIVSQRASSVMHADKIIVLEDGEAVGIGTHDELLGSCEVYREIYESQFGEVTHGV